MNKVWAIAKREFLVTVTRKGYLFTLFGLPLLMIGGLFAASMLSRESFRESQANLGPAGVVDRARVLDFGAGTGVIAAAVLACSPGARVVLLERDAIALVAAARNVPGGTLVLGTGLAHVEDRFDLIVSNPPIHAGSAQSLATVEALIREAPGAVAPGGSMMLVAQRRLPIPRLLGASFRNIRTVADRGPHRVWAAEGPRC